MMPQPRPDDIAVVGSPSTNTELTLDLLQEAAEEKVVGALVTFGAVQDGCPIRVVGQIVSVELRNRWHEDSVFRNLIKRTGEIPPITSRQDTRTAALVVGATFARREGGYEPEVLGMVPPTGTRVRRVVQPDLEEMLALYRDEVFYLGRAYGNDLLFPMWFKHFGSGPGGAGDAYHFGVFGKTGSGKSGLAKYLLTAYARHRQMGILVVDPQGEFSLELSGHQVGTQGFDLNGTIRRLRPDVRVLTIQDLQLEEWDLFGELLVATRFFERLGIPAASADNARRASEVVEEVLRRQRVTLTNLYRRESFDTALRAFLEPRHAETVYSTRARAQQLSDRVAGLLGDHVTCQAAYEESWLPVADLFREGPTRVRVRRLVHQILESEPTFFGSRPLVVVDLSEQGNRRFWSEELQKRLLNTLFSTLYQVATATLSTRQPANTLVILDEAHRFAPAGPLDQDSQAYQLRATLQRAVRETRKYGVGWFFISQTLGSLDTSILQQLSFSVSGWPWARNSAGCASSRAGTTVPWSSTSRSGIPRAPLARICASSLSWRWARCPPYLSAVGPSSSRRLRIPVSFCAATALRAGTHESAAPRFWTADRERVCYNRPWRAYPCWRRWRGGATPYWCAAPASIT